MSNFIARIQLNSAVDNDYEMLHREIEKSPEVLRKKNVFVKADKVKKGEFNYRGNISLAEVVDAVYRAIRKTGRNYSFTVMKNKGNFYPG
ncbi:MAG TPA: hypothetical protein VL307_09995 [Chitinophagaceae bacterium]|nr:hypothetical protein [Chitinophagaceae bacterium]